MGHHVTVLEPSTLKDVHDDLPYTYERTMPALTLHRNTFSLNTPPTMHYGTTITHSWTTPTRSPSTQPFLMPDNDFWFLAVLSELWQHFMFPDNSFWCLVVHSGLNINSSKEHSLMKRALSLGVHWEYIFSSGTHLLTKSIFDHQNNFCSPKAYLIRLHTPITRTISWWCLQVLVCMNMNYLNEKKCVAFFVL